jgi:hypothetical protein
VTPPPFTFPIAPYRLSGTVLGCLLKHRPALAALGDAMHRPPHKAPPWAPVLYVKPHNALAGDSLYRPAARHIARDGFCPLAPRLLPRPQLTD